MASDERLTWNTVTTLADARDDMSRIYVTALRKLAKVTGVDVDDLEGMRALHTVIRQESRARYRELDAEAAKKSGAIRPPRVYGDNQP